MDTMTRRVLVTGATGFIGSFLSRRLLADGWLVRGTRLAGEDPGLLPEQVESVQIEPLGPATPWQHALEAVDTVVHLAARVHLMSDPSVDPMLEYERVNIAGTKRLAREAVRAGVKRLVFISSIKVNGEESRDRYTEQSRPGPRDPYGISKWRAEEVLRRIEAETGLEVVVVRPTLVYGPGVKANFLRMLQAVHRGMPMPFASISNKRSLVYVGNLVDALATCARHPNAAGKTFLLSDGEDLSTPELLRAAASALGKRSLLFPVPVPLLSLAGAVTGKKAAVDRLVGSLSVDSSKIREELDWQPPYDLKEGLRHTAEWFLDTQGGAP